MGYVSDYVPFGCNDRAVFGGTPISSNIMGVAARRRHGGALNTAHEEPTHTPPAAGTNPPDTSSRSWRRR